MRPIQRVIACGFATAAIASASLPALSGSGWSSDEGEPSSSTQAAEAASVRMAQADRQGVRTREMREEIVRDAREVFGLATESNRR